MFEGAEVNFVDAAQGTFLRILNVGGATGLRILESGTKPHSLTAPAITGQYVGGTFTATTGIWTGSPTSFIYQWQSSTDGTTWTDISEATSSSYVPDTSLLGDFLRVLVSAANANGTSLPTPSAASAALTQAPYPAGLVHYWKFDDSLDDSVGSNTLSNTNSVGFAVGKINSAASFDRSLSQFLSGPLTGLTGSWSIAGWVKAVTSNENGEYPCFWQLQDANGNPMTLVIQDSAGTTGWVYISDPNFGDINLGMSNPAFTWGTDEFHHVVVTVDNSGDGGVLTVFIDGVQQETGTVSYHFNPTSIVIGAQYRDGFQAFGDCLVDEVGLWNRALSAADVAQVFNNGNGLPYSA